VLRESGSEERRKTVGASLPETGPRSQRTSPRTQPDSTRRSQSPFVPSTSRVGTRRAMRVVRVVRVVSAVSAVRSVRNRARAVRRAREWLRESGSEEQRKTVGASLPGTGPRSQRTSPRTQPDSTRRSQSPFVPSTSHVGTRHAVRVLRSVRNRARAVRRAPRRKR
jgi:hypothetical protein